MLRFCFTFKLAAIYKCTAMSHVKTFQPVDCHYSHISVLLAGVRGTYQGLTATVLKQGSNQAIRFYVMNLLRNWYKGKKTNES